MKINIINIKMIALKLLCMLILTTIISGCQNSSNEEKISLIRQEIEGRTEYILAINNIPTFIIYSDSIIKFINIANKEKEKSFEEYSFETNGKLYSNLKYNNKGQLDGFGYFYYPNGNIKSFRRYKEGAYEDYGEDYKEENGICKRRIFYDSSGVYFYYVEFSDSSREYSASFNRNNPNSYRLIDRYAVEPYRTGLLNKMKELKLDK